MSQNLCLQARCKSKECYATAISIKGVKCSKAIVIILILPITLGAYAILEARAWFVIL
jgi:hypothetical protein